MEILWLVLIWVLLLYFIRLHRELSLYKRIINQHKDIYVPTLSEMVESSSPGRQIFTGLLEFWTLAFTSFRQKMNNMYKKNEAPELPIIIHEKELKF